MATAPRAIAVPTRSSRSNSAVRRRVGALLVCLAAVGGCYAPSRTTTLFEAAVLGYGARTGAPPYSENGNFGGDHERNAAAGALSQWRYQFPAGATGEQFRALVIDSGYVCEDRTDLSRTYILCYAERRFRREDVLFGFQNALVRLRIVLVFERDGENIVLTGYSWQKLGELN